MHAAMMYAIHFGVYPRAGDDTAQVHGHSDPNVEHEIELPNVMHESGIKAAFVSGSWGCWGPADQSTDGDNSLHVVFYTDRLPDAGFIANLHGILTITLPGLDALRGRVVDYAIVSTDDWSEQSHIATVGGRPHVVVHETRVVDSTYHNPAELDLEE